MGKKFMGLGGTDHFWDRAKAWILNQITSAVTAKIAEVVANAPEDLDTLKEIADWISAHADDAAAMNTQITENKNNIATNTSDISALKTSVAGKADKVHTHTKAQITDFPTSLKNPNALTINGKTYDGSSAVDAGVQTVSNGGTGVTTQLDINKAFIGNLAEGTSDVTDGTEFVSSYASNNGFSAPEAVNDPFRRKFSTVWNYIRGKISSVLGLTKDNYGGKASTAGTADKLKSTQIPDGADLNNYHTPGFYHAIDNTNYANAPITNFTLQVIQLMGFYTFQVLYAYGSNLIYTRSFIYVNGHMSWTKWVHTVMQE